MLECIRPDVKRGEEWVVRQFEISGAHFLSGPRVVGVNRTSYCSTSPTRSSILQSVLETPAAIAGDILSVL